MACDSDRKVLATSAFAAQLAVTATPLASARTWPRAARRQGQGSALLRLKDLGVSGPDSNA